MSDVSSIDITPRKLWTLFDKAHEEGNLERMLAIIFWAEERIEKSVSATEVEFLYTQLELMTSLYLNKVREND